MGSLENLMEWVVVVVVADKTILVPQRGEG